CLPAAERPAGLDRRVHRRHGARGHQRVAVGPAGTDRVPAPGLPRRLGDTRRRGVHRDLALDGATGPHRHARPGHGRALLLAGRRPLLPASRDLRSPARRPDPAHPREPRRPTARPDLVRPVPLERDAAREVHRVDGQHAVQHVVPQDARGHLRLDGAGGDGELCRGREARSVAEGTGAVPPSGSDTGRLTTTRNRAFLFAILAIALVALAVRVVFVLVVDPKLPDPGDATAYHLLANNLADGRGYIRPFDFRILHITRPTAEYPPLFPALLAVPSFLGAKSVDAQRLLRCFVGTGTVVLVGF